jgi:hypothetical protein
MVYVVPFNPDSLASMPGPCYGHNIPRLALPVKVSPTAVAGWRRTSSATPPAGQVHKLALLYFPLE